MADHAHNETDKLLEQMEKRISAIYAEAQAEMKEKAEAYFDKFAAEGERKKKLVEAGKLSEAEYKKWVKNKIAYGKRFDQFKRQYAEAMTHVNEIAAAYINDQIPEIYALNYNGAGEDIASQVAGYQFTMADANTVKNLATRDTTLLPYKYIDGKKDVRWNTQKVNAAITQGILQGESIPNIAKRLSKNIPEMNKASAIRNARTATTGAECAGRQSQYEEATRRGIQLQREWIAAIDMRTRHAHRLLDGQLADVDKPFESELGDIMFPGDPEAHPANVYNCRCTVAAKVIGFEKAQVQKAMAEKQSIGIESAKTNQDVVEQMNQNGWFSSESRYSASLDGADFESAVAVYRGYEKFFDRYPQMKGKFLPVVCENLSRSQAYAQASTFGGGVSVNRARYSNARKLAEDYSKDVRLGFHTKGTDYQSLVTHECGHGLDGYLTSVFGSKKSFSMDMRKRVLKETGSTLSDVADGVSIYATKDNYEFFAECLAEGLWSENPRPIAKEFMKQLDEVMKGVK